MTGRLAPQPWMTAAETRAVLDALTAEGGEVRFVGGCVRDAVLGRPVKDVDIATHDPPERVIALLERAGLKAVPTGIEHGTITAVVGGKHFEITTLRRDVETYGRRARVEFTDDWAADAARRDLTMNALFCGPDGTLYDPFGGLADLRAGRVRFVGEARERIREDVLRLLRFFRFYAHYGRPPPDPEALAAAKALAPLLPTLSGERVCGETFKLLRAPDPAPVFELMAGEGVLARFLPEAANLARLGALVAIEAAVAGADPVRRLAALLDGTRASSAAVATRLRLSNRERDRLIGLAEAPPLSPDLDPAARRRLRHRLGAERFRDLALLAWAGGAAAPPDSAAWRDLLAGADWTPPAFPVKGKDAVRLGVPAGPEVGRLIAAVEEWWAAEDFRPDRKACLKKLRELAAEGPAPTHG
ncbi:MAG TPA: CCA tRNA nucleotidyltransferase [Dongiaceae bacterium]|nr:CCA tRNA nucleotidyltransferase [Dongiaceae bacterium]